MFRYSQISSILLAGFFLFSFSRCCNIQRNQSWTRWIASTAGFGFARQHTTVPRRRLLRRRRGANHPRRQPPIPGESSGQFQNEEHPDSETILASNLTEARSARAEERHRRKRDYERLRILLSLGSELCQWEERLGWENGIRRLDVVYVERQVPLVKEFGNDTGWY